MSLNGRLEDLDLSDIFQILSLSKRSGVLTIIRKDTTGRLVFKEGLLLYGSSDSVNKIGQTLVRKKMLTNDELEKALESQKITDEQLPLGSILLKIGAISKEDLQSELKNHLTDVVKNFLGWETGSFHFNVQSIQDKDPLLDKGLDLDFLLMEAARLKDEEQRDKTKDPSKAAVDTEMQADDHIQLADFMDSPPAVKSQEKPSEEERPSTEPKEKIQKTIALDPSPNKDLSLLSAMIEEISRPATTGEITLMVLRYATEVMNRVVIFVTRDEEIIGSGQSGITFEEGSPDKKIRELSISLSKPSLFKDAIQKKACFRGELADNPCHKDFIRHIESEWPEEVFVAPLYKGEKLTGLLYGDNLPEKKPMGDTEGFEEFLKVAGYSFGHEKSDTEIQIIETDQLIQP